MLKSKQSAPHRSKAHAVQTMNKIFSSFCRYNEIIIGEENEPRHTIILNEILCNLIEILVGFDYSDEIGRKCLRTLSIDLLRSRNPCNEQTIKCLVHICEELIRSPDDRLQMYSDVIRILFDRASMEQLVNLEHPNVVTTMENDAHFSFRVTSLKLTLCLLNEQTNEFIVRKDFARASRKAQDILTKQHQLTDLILPLLTIGSVRQMNLEIFVQSHNV